MARPTRDGVHSSAPGAETAELRLLELEALYQEAPVGLCFVDTEMRFLRVNERLAAVSGNPVQAHIGRTVDEMIPEIADQVVPYYRRIVETGEPVRNLEVRGTLPSEPGTEHVWLVHHHPVKASDGTVTGIMTVMQDITEIAMAQAELERVKEHLARAQHVAGVGSWEWNVVEDRVWWSEELYPIFRRDPNRLQPSLNSFFDLMHPEDRPMIRKQLTATLERGDPYAIVFRIELADGSLRVIEAHAALERGADGAPLRLIGTVRDVTDRKLSGQASAIASDSD